jgi:uncharacterized protein
MRIELKVITRAKKEIVEKISDNNYRVKVSAPPEKGKANKRVIELLSEKLCIKKQDIKIISGETNNKKILEIK